MWVFYFGLAIAYIPAVLVVVINTDSYDPRVAVLGIIIDCLQEWLEVGSIVGVLLNHGNLYGLELHMVVHFVQHLLFYQPQVPYRFWDHIRL